MQFDWRFPDGALPRLPRLMIGSTPSFKYATSVLITITGAGTAEPDLDDLPPLDQVLIEEIDRRIRTIAADAETYQELALAAAEAAVDVTRMNEEMLQLAVHESVRTSTRIVLSAPFLGDARYRYDSALAVCNPGKFAVISLPGGVVTMHRPARPFEKLRRWAGF